MILTLPKGEELEFPDDTPEHVIQKVIGRDYPGTSPVADNAYALDQQMQAAQAEAPGTGILSRSMQTAAAFPGGVVDTVRALPETIAMIPEALGQLHERGVQAGEERRRMMTSPPMPPPQIFLPPDPLKPGFKVPGTGNLTPVPLPQGPPVPPVGTGPDPGQALENTLGSQIALDAAYNTMDQAAQSDYQARYQAAVLEAQQQQQNGMWAGGPGLVGPSPGGGTVPWNTMMRTPNKLTADLATSIEILDKIFPGTDSGLIRQFAEQAREGSELLEGAYPRVQPTGDLKKDLLNPALQTQTVLEMLGPLAISLGTAGVGGIALGGALGGAFEASNFYQNAIKQKKDPEESAGKAVIYGLISGGLNAASLSQFLKTLPPGIGGKILARLTSGAAEVVTEGPGETIAADLLSRGKVDMQTLRDMAQVIPAAGGLGLVLGGGAPGGARPAQVAPVAPLAPDVRPGAVTPEMAARVRAEAQAARGEMPPGAEMPPTTAEPIRQSTVGMEITPDGLRPIVEESLTTQKIQPTMPQEPPAPETSTGLPPGERVAQPAPRTAAEQGVEEQVAAMSNKDRRDLVRNADGKAPIKNVDVETRATEILRQRQQSLAGESAPSVAVGGTSPAPGPGLNEPILPGAVVQPPSPAVAQAQNAAPGTNIFQRHALGVRAAKDLGGQVPQKDVDAADKALEGIRPTERKIKDGLRTEKQQIRNKYEVTRPVTGDTWILRDGSIVEVGTIKSTSTGKTAIELHHIGKKKGRTWDEYVDKNWVQEESPAPLSLQRRGCQKRRLPKRNGLTRNRYKRRFRGLLWPKNRAAQASLSVCLTAKRSRWSRVKIFRLTFQA